MRVCPVQKEEQDSAEMILTELELLYKDSKHTIVRLIVPAGRCSQSATPKDHFVKIARRPQ